MGIGYINPYYWVDDHPLLYGNNGNLDPGTHTHYWRILQTLNDPKDGIFDRSGYRDIGGYSPVESSPKKQMKGDQEST